MVLAEGIRAPSVTCSSCLFFPKDELKGVMTLFAYLVVFILKQKSLFVRKVSARLL